MTGLDLCVELQTALSFPLMHRTRRDTRPAGCNRTTDYRYSELRNLPSAYFTMLSN